MVRKNLTKSTNNVVRFTFRWVMVLVLLFAVSGDLLVSNTGDIIQPPTQDTNKDIDSWQASILNSRQEKDKEFKTAPDSPMAGVERLIVKAEPGKKTYVGMNEKNNSIALEKQQTPAALFSLEKIATPEGDKWRWETLNKATGKTLNKKVVTCRNGEKKLESGAVLPGYVLFETGRFSLPAYTVGEELVLLVFDPQRPEIQQFSHLLYFPPDKAFAVQARLERLPGNRTVTMLTSRNLEKTYHAYAFVHFKIKEKELKLTAFKFALSGPGSEILFIPFMDQTSGRETYGGGRFLEIPEPLEDTFILDFNQCFNPLCNYAPVYNCPVPPRENVLDVPILAGEKTYPIHH